MKNFLLLYSRVSLHHIYTFLIIVVTYSITVKISTFSEIGLQILQSNADIELESGKFFNNADNELSNNLNVQNEEMPGTFTLSILQNTSDFEFIDVSYNP